MLVYADHEKPGEQSFDRFIIGGAHTDAEPAADALQSKLERVGTNIERQVPNRAWHWCHIARIVPLAAAAYHHEQDLDAVVADRTLLKKTMRATVLSFPAIGRLGYPVLFRGLNFVRWIPAMFGADYCCCIN